jgi:hypothetical protein
MYIAKFRKHKAQNSDTQLRHYGKAKEKVWKNTTKPKEPWWSWPLKLGQLGMVLRNRDGEGRRYGGVEWY